MESNFTIKDSGQRQEFATGSRRDTDEGKPRLSLIPPLVLSRLAMVYTTGAKKYGDNNWQKGQPLSRYYDSAMRHMLAAREGREDEDHLFQAAWNMAAIAWTLEECRAGRLPENLVDMPFRMPGDMAKKLDELFLGPMKYGGTLADPDDAHVPTPDPVPPNHFIPGSNHRAGCVCSKCEKRATPALEGHSGDADGYSRTAPHARDR